MTSKAKVVTTPLVSKTKKAPSFDRGLFVINEKIPHYFTCPESAKIILESRTGTFDTLNDLQKLVSRANKAMGSTNDCLAVVARKDTEYVRITCKFKNCPYSQWFNFEENFTNLKYARSINLNHSLEYHEKGEFRQEYQE